MWSNDSEKEKCELKNDRSFFHNIVLEILTDPAVIDDHRERDIFFISVAKA